jgi:oxalate decarboxylase/phosphoglucose isomerase-like protein (cupin superfamily)
MADVEFIDISSEIQEGQRGTSFFPWQGRLEVPRDLLRTFHLISINPGETRGNHLHPGHTEWLYPFHGPGVLIWKEGGKTRERLVAGGRTLIHISPGIAHALRNPGAEVLYLLAWREAADGETGKPETIASPLPAKPE